MRYRFGSEPEAAPAPARGRRPGRGALLARAADRRRYPETHPAALRALAPPQRFSKTPTVLGFFPPPFHLLGHLLPAGFPGPRNDRNRPRRAGFKFRLASKVF